MSSMERRKSGEDWSGVGEGREGKEWHAERIEWRELAS